jgi:putative chitinase
VFNDEQLAAALKCPVARATRWAPHLRRSMQRNGITTGRRVAQFLAALGHESLGLARVEENLNYSEARLLEVFPKYFDRSTAAAYARQPERIANRVYANRMGNGPAASGDGFRYRGRSPIQLTGRDNYRAMGELLDHPLLEQPDLALREDVGSDIAAAWWRARGLNALADAADVLAISRVINLGTQRTTRMPIGMADRADRARNAMAALGVA